MKLGFPFGIAPFPLSFCRRAFLYGCPHDPPPPPSNYVRFNDPISIFFFTSTSLLVCLASYVVLAAFLDRSFLAFLAFPPCQSAQFFAYTASFLLRSFYLHHHHTYTTHPSIFFVFTFHTPSTSLSHSRTNPFGPRILVPHPLPR